MRYIIVQSPRNGRHRSIVLFQLYLAPFKFNREAHRLRFLESKEIAESLKHRTLWSLLSRYTFNCWFNAI